MKVKLFLDGEKATKIYKTIKCEFLFLPINFSSSKLKTVLEDASEIKDFLKQLNFQGKDDQTRIFYNNNKLYVLCGLGKLSKLTTLKIRTRMKKIFKEVEDMDCHHIIMHCISMKESFIRAQLESLYDANYNFKKKDNFQIVFIPVTSDSNHLKLKQIVSDSELIMKEINFIRKMVDLPSNQKQPANLVKHFKKHNSKGINFKVTLEKELEKQNMRLLTSVSKGSEDSARLITLTLKGNSSDVIDTCLIGKGVTYDSGGYDLKLKGMNEMKSDMAGAATCFAVIQILHALKTKKNFKVLLPIVENMVDSKATRPGDVIEAHNKLKVEITDTDAEGRLILADCLSYAKKFNPKEIIDVATLTGAAEIITGGRAAVLYCHDKQMTKKLLECSRETDDRLIHIPYYPEEYEEVLESKIGDCVNWTDKVKDGSTLAAAFLGKFTDTLKWAHIDNAPNAYNTDIGATGATVRVLVEYLK